MSVVSVKARSFILALFIRDDGERFLLGDNGFDFKDSQLHFSANTIENDEVAKQGVDGIMLAGQVRRASVQSFDGYVGDGTTLKEEVEQMRRDFFAFFASGHHFRVIYIDCNKNAWQRKGGYLVDAPEVKELWQIHPEYHVGLNFEDVNYYGYDESAEGEEILSNIISVPISSDVEGGLVWDGDGAVSEPAVVEYDTETANASGANISISNAAAAPLSSFSLKGNTEQDGTPTPDAPVAVQTVTGENVVKICGKNLINVVDSEVTQATRCTHEAVDGGVKIVASGASGLSYCMFDVHNQGNILGKTVYISCNAAAEVSSAHIGVYQLNNGAYTQIGNNIPISGGSVLIPATLISDTSIIRVGFYVSSGTAAAGTALTITNAQLELGSTATAYEPYRGQSYEVNLGKNIIDVDFTSGTGSGGYVWDAGGEGGPTIVMNESITGVSPVWTVFGPTLNPMLENTTTGEHIEYIGMVGEGQTLVVDMGEQTASLDGLNVISNIVGDFLTLAPGSNTLLFSAESAAPASEIGWSEIVG